MVYFSKIDILLYFSFISITDFLVNSNKTALELDHILVL